MTYRYDKKTLDRFFAKTEQGENGCLNWTGAIVQAVGYGRFWIDNIVDYAHRASWKIHFSDIPEDMLVCHHCDNRICVEPSHLFLGTFKDNMRDASNKNRIKIPRQSYASSEEHQPAKLTNAQVLEIRNSSMGLTALSRKFEVSRSAIWAAKTHRTFRDI